MCYDISFSSSLELITDYLPDLVIESQLTFDYDSNSHVLAQAFKKEAVIIFREGRYRLVDMEWGIIANYMDTPEKIKMFRSKMCNAQSEKILDDKRSFWYRIRKNRCLIPMPGFYEHRKVNGFKNKIPYFIRQKGRAIFGVPGLYYENPVRPSNAETGEVVSMFTVITRPGNEIMRQIHNDGDNAFRMPLMLRDKEHELQWLRADLTEKEMRELLTFELPSNAIDYHTVWTIRTTKPHPAGGLKTDPYLWPNLPDLGHDDAGVSSGLFDTQEPQ